jgi:hypothetical protein
MKSAGARDLIGRQNAGFGAGRRRFVKTHSPDIDVVHGKCGHRRA